jgi:protease-4
MNKFFQQTLASFLGSIAGLFVFFALGASSLLVLVIALLLSDTTLQLEDKSVLVFNLSSQIKDSQSDSSLEDILLADEIEIITLRQVIEAIEKATEDDRIVALFLDGRRGSINSGYASLTEIRSALERFRASGKKIIAYNVSWNEKDYYLGSVADTIIINPMGLMEIDGFSSPQLFFAAALEKYGIGVQVIRAGKYKAAIEPFTRNNYSPESRQQTEELLTDLWNIYRNKVSVSRKLTLNKIQVIADNQAILNPAEAQTFGLIDKVAYFDEVVAYLQTITNSNKRESFPQTSLKKYLELSQNIQTSKNKIALLYTEGTIVGGEGNLGQIGSERWAKELKKLRENEAIKGVVLRINSPGGSAVASDIILRELQLTAQQKPIVVSMGNVAASGGYWIATAGEKIFAEKNTITGSIGVFGLLFNLQEIANDNGINYDVVKTGKFADLNVGLRPKTEAELNIYQKNVDQFYNLFLEKVAEARNLSPEKVAAIAQGRVWSGEDAQTLGLVDEIGGLEAAIEYTVNKLGLDDDWEIEEYPEKRSWETEIWEKLAETKLQEKINAPETMTAAIWQLKSELVIWEVLQEPNNIYAILPFKLEIK